MHKIQDDNNIYGVDNHRNLRAFNCMNELCIDVCCFVILTVTLDYLQAISGHKSTY